MLKPQVLGAVFYLLGNDVKGFILAYSYIVYRTWERLKNETNITNIFEEGNYGT